MAEIGIEPEHSACGAGLTNGGTSGVPALDQLSMR